MIERLEKIRFVAANFPGLKGLNMMVIGFCLTGVSLWAGYNPGDLTFPITLMLITVILVVILERYHRYLFGQVRATQHTRRLDLAVSLVFGVIGLAAFVIDTLEAIPVSILGITFALGLWVDFLRINRLGTKKFLTYYRWFAILLFVVSVTLAFWRNFWALAGFDSPVTGILTLVGVITFITGLRVHLFLVQSLISHTEVIDDQSV
jgi:hypothetical protein